jgi:hypothetical protein
MPAISPDSGSDGSAHLAAKANSMPITGPAASAMAPKRRLPRRSCRVVSSIIQAAAMSMTMAP